MRGGKIFYPDNRTELDSCKRENKYQASHVEEKMLGGEQGLDNDLSCKLR